jgi:hypothetical protein
MWHWDQGHLAYFQFDALRQIAAFVRQNDFIAADRQELMAGTGLAFAGPATHSAWRQYARALRICLLVSKVGESAVATPVAELLSTPGLVTCDEYFHFLIRSFTEPSPALQAWTPHSPCRYPLLFALKYMLTKRVVEHQPVSTFDEIIGAYRGTGLTGMENEVAFAALAGQSEQFILAGQNAPGELRQARESLHVIAQISYLHLEGPNLIVSLDPIDAHNIFNDLQAIVGPKADDRESELRRLAGLFRDGANEDFYDYPNTVTNDIVESGFQEGTKVKKTHIVIERNQVLRAEFFKANPASTCDLCDLDTAATYPWTVRVLDLHHLLPLSSGTRVEKDGTTFSDLVPVCPNCHRAIHRFYDRWLVAHDLADFPTEHDAKQVYQNLKSDFGGPIYV